MRGEKEERKRGEKEERGDSPGLSAALCNSGSASVRTHQPGEKTPSTTHTVRHTSTHITASTHTHAHIHLPLVI